MKTTITEHSPKWSHGSQLCVTQWNYEPYHIGPPQMDSREFWQNMIHWRREWQTTSAFLPWEPPKQYEKAKRYDTEGWTPSHPRLVGVQYATGEEWRNNSRRNEEPKWKWHLVSVTAGESKVQCCKEQYCIGTWMLGPWIKVNWMWSNWKWQEWTSTFYESVN